MPIPYLILVPLICGLVAQLLKLVFRPQKISWETLVSYGGMPSSHAALLASLCTIIALKEGLNSVAFAVACVISLILLRDAFGLRKYLGEQGKVLNRIIARLSKEEGEKLPRRLEEKIGHTLPEIFVGILIGVGISLLFYPLI